MFVHWGVYSTTGGLYRGQKLPSSAEWMMCRGKIPIAEYEQYADQFNPTKFDADQFVGLAKQAGMKYLVITAKHHDGFAMFGSQCSDWDVVDKTPFGRDIMKELADAVFTILKPKIGITPVGLATIGTKRSSVSAATSM